MISKPSGMAVIMVPMSMGPVCQREKARVLIRPMVECLAFCYASFLRGRHFMYLFFSSTISHMPESAIFDRASSLL